MYAKHSRPWLRLCCCLNARPLVNLPSRHLGALAFLVCAYLYGELVQPRITNFTAEYACVGQVSAETEVMIRQSYGAKEDLFALSLQRLME